MPFDPSKPFDALLNNPNIPESDSDYGDSAAKYLANYPNIRGFLGLNAPNDKSGNTGEKIRNVANIVTDLLPFAGARGAWQAAGKAQDMSKLNIFGGVLAKDAPKDQKSWWKRPGLKDSFEIDDSKSSVSSAFNSAVPGERNVSTVGDFLDHPELFKQYPGLKDYHITYTRDPKGRKGGTGSFDPEDNIINITAKDAEEARSVLIHELNHGVQQIEGFASGGSASKITTGPMAQAKANLMRKAGMPEEKVQLQEQLAKYPNTEQGRVAAYYDLQGERDSRLTQRRLDMSASERAAYSPDSDMRSMVASEQAKHPAYPFQQTPIYLDQMGNPFSNPLLKSTVK